MTTVIQSSICKECKNETFMKCHFCHQFICHDHVHYLGVPHHSIYGISSDTIVVCESCKPKF